MLLILEALHSALSIHAIYSYTILNYLNPLGLLKATWSATMTIGVTSVLELVVHIFYVRRVYHVSKKNIPLIALLSALVLAHLGTGLAVTIRAFQLEFFAAFVEITGIVDASLALAVVTDVIIAGSLSFYLHTSRSGVTSTDTLINKLMAYAINNGILTSVFDIIVLIYVTTQPHNLIFLAVFQIVGNLYTNSMMATLNSRISLSNARHSIMNGSSQAMNTFRVPGSATAVPTEDSEISGDGKHRFIEITTTKDIRMV